jgi:hypothetical protein
MAAEGDAKADRQHPIAGETTRKALVPFVLHDSCAMTQFVSDRKSGRYVRGLK